MRFPFRLRSYLHLRLRPPFHFRWYRKLNLCFYKPNRLPPFNLLPHGRSVTHPLRHATTCLPPPTRTSVRTSKTLRNSGSSLQMNNGGFANPDGQRGYALGNQAPPHQVCLGKGVTSSWSPSPLFRYLSRGTTLSRNGATPIAVSHVTL